MSELESIFEKYDSHIELIREQAKNLEKNTNMLGDSFLMTSNGVSK